MWEYLSTNIDTANYSLERELNKLGRQGWEVVSHRVNDSSPWRHDFLFKRRLAVGSFTIGET